MCGLFGRAVPVDPIKPRLKPPETKHLQLKCDMLLSTVAFKFNLRRYNLVKPGRVPLHLLDASACNRAAAAALAAAAAALAVAALAPRWHQHRPRVTPR
jgi:hypothetical protein